MTNVNKENFRKMMVVNNPNKIKMSKAHAEGLLLSYWMENGIPTTLDELYPGDVEDIMNGDLTRLMIDPHKYASIDEEEEEEVTMGELEHEIKTKIVMLKEDQNEFDGDPDLYELYYHNKQIQIETLQDVLLAMKGEEL